MSYEFERYDNIRCKIRCLKWRPNFHNQIELQCVYGTWGNIKNQIGLYNLNSNNINTINHDGAVNDLVFISSDIIATAADNGKISFVQIDNNNNNNLSMMKVINTKANVTCLDVDSRLNLDETRQRTIYSKMVSSGENGFINVFDISQMQHVRNIKWNCASPTYKVKFHNQNLVVSAGLSGRIMIWDIRSNNNQPVDILEDAQAIGFSSLCPHPIRREILVSGSLSNGLLSTWDIRQFSTPIGSFVAHTGSVTDLVFVKDDSRYLWSCGNDGDIISWDFNKHNQQNNLISYKSGDVDHVSAKNIHHEVLPLNCMDYQSYRMIIGSDKESFLSCSVMDNKNI